MKKLILLLPALTIMLLAGCKKNMEEGPLENLDEDYIFDPVDVNGNYSEQFLSDIYAQMPTGYNRINNNMLDAATDDAVPSQNGTTIDQMITGRVDPFLNPEDALPKYYTAIRKVNVFLSKIDRVPKLEETRNFWKNEARFLRALFYFELVKRYGGIPLMGDKVPTLQDDLSYKRNSFEECINYIVSELDAIKDIVRPDPVPDADWGRISKGIVLSLKSRVLLYAASPLYNGGNIGTTSEQKLVAGYASFDVERWRNAAKAADDVMKTGTYSLEAKYMDVFLARKNKEIILNYLRAVTNDVEQNNGPIGYSRFDARGYTSPSQDLAEAFLMTNNKPITDLTSGYNPNKPTDNRDARFGVIFFVNESRWFKRNVETFEGGLDKPGGSATQTKTSYYLRKFLYNANEASSYATQAHNFPIMRYAEILLNYAEATNEADGPTVAAQNALKQVRKRGSLVDFPANITKDAFRELVRAERRVELCFEEHRYWDVRRWKIAETVLNKNIRGQKITRKQDGTYTYENVVAGKIAFAAPRAYLYPIMQSELYKNKNLIQNPGW